MGFDGTLSLLSVCNIILWNIVTVESVTEYLHNVRVH